MTKPHSKNRLEQLLTLFTEMRAGEGTTAILLFFNLFLLLTSYYIAKAVREGLILSESGAEIKSYLSAGQAVLLLAIVPLYSLLASKFARRRLINIVTLFFAACLLIFFILAHIQIPLGIMFFIWVGIFSLMIISQFWAFANDIYTPEAGKRLFVIIAFGASAGSILGGMIANWLIEPLGLYQLMLVAGALLLLSLVLTNIVDTREKNKSRELDSSQAQELDEPLKKGNAFSMVFQNKYLLLIAFLLLFLNWVNTTGEYILGQTVSTAAANAVSNGTAGGLTIGEYITKFYARFFTVVNFVSTVTQLFIVSRIFKYLGIRVALLFLPVIALGGYFLIAFVPVFSIIRWTKTAENATDYSLQNTVRHVLFLPTTREQKYKAKQAIDTFFVRAGDVLSAGLVYVGLNRLSFGTKQFALFNLALVVVWLVLAIIIGIEYKKIMKLI